MTGWCAACGFRCSNDYVDIYTQLSRPDEPLLEAALHGRYCGYTADELPHLLVSMHELLVLILYTDGRSNDDGFLARYQFIDAGEQSDTPLRPPPLPGAATTWHTARLPSASGDDVLTECEWRRRPFVPRSLFTLDILVFVRQRRCCPKL